MSSEKSKNLPINLLRILIWVVAAIFFTTLTLAWIFYGETYLPIEEFISNLGRTETRNLLPNGTSSTIFSIGLAIISLATVIMAVIYFKPKNYSPLNLIKGIILILMATGAALVAFPANLYMTMHDWGAIAFIGSFDIYAFFCQFTRFKHRKITFDTEESHKITPDKYYIFVLLLISILFLVAVLMGYGEILPLIQKILVIGILIGVSILDPEDF
ncbi:MAG: hypothetical protein ACTSVU_02135 [Promethearchaeota archaeon]